MQITTKDWKKYISQMSKISQTAADRMQEWISKHGFADDKALLDYAYALSTHYGEAIGALSCQMYEATAAAQNVIIPAAEAVATPEYGEVAKAVHGAKKRSEKMVPDTVGRLVKQVGADTTLRNAERDGAQFAWVPMGDTCAFCLTLASRGWQYMSKKALRNGHAEHIHANCDCQYAVRFDNKSTVEGYDPDKYLEMYENAEGRTPQEKINAMRRAMVADKRQMAANKDSIWPKKQVKISNDEYKELMKYAREQGIELSGFKQYDGDISVIKDVIDDAKSIASKYPDIVTGKKKLTFSLSGLLDDEDFAVTNGHIIELNANAFRNVELLEKEYQKMVAEKWFVPGTDHHSIVFHEVGHVVANHYKINPLEIAEKVTELRKAALMEYVEGDLSRYAVKYADGREIIAEAFSSVYGSGNSEFALKFVEACDSMIVGGGA